MFTGIIQQIGIVREVNQTTNGVRLLIDPQDWDHRPNPGDSVANNGCCLTLVEPLNEHDGFMTFDAIPETLEKTTLGSWKSGDRVNLERPLRIGDGLDGHQVQGHVDGVAQVLLVNDEDGYRVRLSIGAQLMPFMIPKGSITIDGISLTIADLDVKDHWVEVALIPETLQRTNLMFKKAGDRVNIEADVMVKTIVHTMNHYQEMMSNGSV